MEHVLVLNGLSFAGAAEISLTVGGNTLLRGATEVESSDPRIVVVASDENGVPKLVGKAFGETTVTYKQSGQRKTVKVKVSGISEEKAVEFATDVWNTVKDFTGRPEIDADLADPNVLREYYDTLYPILRKVYATARELPGEEGGEAGAWTMLEVLEVAKRRPELKTMRDILKEIGRNGLVMPPEGARPGRVLVMSGSDERWVVPRCQETRPDDIPFNKTYTVAIRADVLSQFVRAVAKVTAFLVSVFTTVFSVGTLTAAALALTAAALGAAARAMPRFTHSPKELVKDFARAICEGLNGRLPLRMQGVVSARVKIRRAVRMAWVAKEFARLAKDPAEKTRFENLAKNEMIKANVALSKSTIIDDPTMFDDRENRIHNAVVRAIEAWNAGKMKKFEESVDCIMERGTCEFNDSGGGSVAPVLMVGGVAAAAFLAWRFASPSSK
jgi:hypothetical protein